MMIACQKCNHPVDDSAASCPHCGGLPVIKNYLTPRMITGLLLFIFAAGVFIAPYLILPGVGGAAVGGAIGYFNRKQAISRQRAILLINNPEYAQPST